MANLAQDPENGRLCRTMAPHPRPHLKKQGSRGPISHPAESWSLDGQGLHLLRLSALYPPIPKGQSLAILRLIPSWLPNVEASTPLKQRPQAGLLSRLAANQRRRWGRGIRPPDWPPRAPPRPRSRELSGRLGADPAAAHGPRAALRAL